MARLYNYEQEIRMMISALGIKSVDDTTVNFVEDVVAMELRNMLHQVRGLAGMRGSRQIEVADFLFFLRRERGLVSRIRSFLGWKDVHKTFRDPAMLDFAVDVGSLLEAGQNTSETEGGFHRIRRPLHWELDSKYADALDKVAMTQKGKLSLEEEDLESKCSEEPNLKRRKETFNNRSSIMSDEEYIGFCKARQASFLGRKAKRFCDFCNLQAFIEGTPDEDLLDVLALLAHEVVVRLCSELKSEGDADGDYEREGAFVSKLDLLRGDIRATLEKESEAQPCVFSCEDQTKCRIPKPNTTLGELRWHMGRVSWNRRRQNKLLRSWKHSGPPGPSHVTFFLG